MQLRRAPPINDKTFTRFGGQRQGGISTPTDAPVILLFTGESGALYGYHDGPQEDGTFWYTGEGQVGDMQMVRGTRAVRNHASAGKTLHLFEDIGNGRVRYIGPSSYADHHPSNGPDRDSNARNVIIFELALEALLGGRRPILLRRSTQTMRGS
jgi:5-methylcytosine-specific restriction protein A